MRLLLSLLLLSGLLGILGLRSQTADLGCDLALFLGHPLVELGLGVALRERALGYAPQKVFLVENTLVREDGAAGEPPSAYLRMQSSRNSLE